MAASPEPKVVASISKQTARQSIVTAGDHHARWRGWVCPGKPPEVYIAAQPTYNEWAFSVRDNGRGIAPEYHDKIFEVFKRLHDLNMPGKDGRTVLKEVKEHPALRQTPVIILTTSDAGTDRLLSYNLHANAYLSKPVDLDDWDDLVRTTAHFWLELVRPPIVN